jgi:hypothetical protein
MQIHETIQTGGVAEKLILAKMLSEGPCTMKELCSVLATVCESEDAVQKVVDKMFVEGQISRTEYEGIVMYFAPLRSASRGETLTTAMTV